MKRLLYILYILLLFTSCKTVKTKTDIDRSIDSTTVSVSTDSTTFKNVMTSVYLDSAFIKAVIESVTFDTQTTDTDGTHPVLNVTTATITKQAVKTSQTEQVRDSSSVSSDNSTSMLQTKENTKSQTKTDSSGKGWLSAVFLFLCILAIFGSLFWFWRQK